MFACFEGDITSKAWGDVSPIKMLANYALVTNIRKGVDAQFTNLIEEDASKDESEQDVKAYEIPTFYPAANYISAGHMLAEVKSLNLLELNDRSVSNLYL